MQREQRFRETAGKGFWPCPSGPVRPEEDPCRRLPVRARELSEGYEMLTTMFTAMLRG
jgi:hypothetical protein